MSTKKSPITIDNLAVMVQQGFEHVTTEMRSGFERIDERIEGLDEKIEGLEKSQQTVFASIRELPSPEAFQKLRAKVSDLNTRLSRLEHKR